MRSSLKDQKQIVKRSMNKNEWTRELDQFMMQSVVRNYFNFQIVSLECDSEAKKLCLDLGSSNVVTSEKCRLRWSYLHLQRKIGKQIVYKSISSLQSASESDTNKENEDVINSSSNRVIAPKEKKQKNQNAPKVQSEIENPKKLIEEKSFKNITEKNAPKTMAEIEANIWKNNIKSGRIDKDFLDTSKEDFSLNKTKGPDGEEVIPSSFNIFRDSLRKTSEKLTVTLKQHLPDMNLKEIDESESERDELSDADVLPLDFRTALIEEDNRVVIQAKPLSLKLDANEEFTKNDPSKGGLDSYLEMIKKESFKDDEGAAIIDPGYDIKEKFEEIDLPCNNERRLNNTINAPIKPTTPRDGSESRRKGPKSNKQYDTDTGASNSEMDDAKQTMKKNIQSIKQQAAKFGEARTLEQVQASETFEATQNDPLSFENSLKQAEEQVNVSDQKTAQQRQERFERILQENRESIKRQEQEDLQDFTNEQMMDDLEQLANDEDDNQEISDSAPVSPYADALSEKEEAAIAKEQKEQDFKNTVKDISSASETDEEKKKKAQKSENQEGDQIKENNNKKVKFYKGMRVMSKEGEEEDEDSKNSSQYSQGSADDYFEQQRKKLKSKSSGGLNKVAKPQPVKKENPKQASKRELESASSEEDSEFQKRLDIEKQIQSKLIQQKKEAALDNERQMKIRKQNEAKQIEIDKRNKDKEALMQRLKEQDAETKRKKKQEREEKDKELSRYRQMQDDTRKEEEDVKQRDHDLKMDKKRSEDRQKIMVEVEHQTKLNDEEELMSDEKWKEYGKTEIPCLYDQKCSYLSQLNVLPQDIELKIQKNQLSQEELNKLKMLTIPLGSHINNGVLSSIIQYFLLNSNMQKVYEKQQTEDEIMKNSFPYKCVSIQMAVTEAPLQALSINQKPGIHMQNKDGVIRVLSLLFDISDEPRIKKESFKGATKKILLKNILTEKQIEQIGCQYKFFITDLAHKYQRVSKINQFPLEIGLANKHIIEFKNQEDLKIEYDSALLSQIAFFSDYTKKTDVVPAMFQGSLEFFRRSPAFYAYNGNKASYTRKDKIKNRIATKNNDFVYEEACVIFKDLSFEPLQECKSTNSLAHFFKKAIIKEGLDIVGLKLVYLDDKNRQDYFTTFHENLEMDSTWEKPVLALVLRGIEANKKIETILGHFNPDLDRRTNQKTLRSCFGRTKKQNCTLSLYQQNKKNLDIKFWFGGRIQRKPKENILEKDEEIKRNEIMLIVPPKIEKHLLLISPCVPTHKLPKILQRLTILGATILDVQKLDFQNLNYQNENIEQLKQDCKTEIRGKTYHTSIGYVVKIARENLYCQFKSQTKLIERDLDGMLEEQSIDNLLFMTKNYDEYKKVLSILKKHNFKVSYLNAKAGGSEGYSAMRRKTDINYDSDDPSEYRSIQLYNQLEIQNQTKSSKTKITAIKKKITTADQGDSFKIQTFICFVKISAFKKQLIGDILQGLLNKFDFELLGLKVIKGTKQLYRDSVSISVINTLKAIACKFHESSTDLKLRKKVKDFKTFALVLRGQDVEKQIDTIYDRTTCKFLDQGSSIFQESQFETSPTLIFLTNKTNTKTMLEFMIETKYVRMFQDMKQNFNFLNGSVDFFNHIKLPEENVFETKKVAEIKETSDLLDAQFCDKKKDEQQTQATCLIKPNQSFNVVMRALKQVSNLNHEKLTFNDQNYVSISKIELVEGLNKSQVDLLLKHDILFDQKLSIGQKERMSKQYPQLFEGKPVWQIMVNGVNVIQKLQNLIGDSDPSLKRGNKDGLRQVYGKDRMDNAYFISQTIQEAQTEQSLLFDQSLNSDAQIDHDKEYIVKKIEEAKAGEISYNNIMKQQMELALVVISPTLVRNNDFIYVLDELSRAKFNICALKKKKIDSLNLEYLFQELAPKTHSLSTLETEFNRGDSIIIVLEKTKAIAELQELIGTFSIKINSDWEKKKSKQSIGYQVNKHTNLVSEYGSYIFSFPNQQRNQEKIAKEFRVLPNSKEFKIEKVQQSYEDMDDLD